MPYRSNPITRALRTYNSALYAARATVHTFRSAKRFFKGKAKPATPVVAKVRAKTRGALAGNPQAFSRSTMAGQQRRNQLAKQLRERRRATSVKKNLGGKSFPRTHSKDDTSVHGAIKLSKTYGQLNRRLLVRATKANTQRLTKGGYTRKEAADYIRQLRRGGSAQRGQHVLGVAKSSFAGGIQQDHAKFRKEAAAIMARGK